MIRKSFWTDADNGILVLRLTLGGTFFLHGWHKVLHGIENQMSILVANGIPGFFIYFVYVSEVLAPILLVLGLFTRLSAISVIVTMVTVFYVLPGPFFALTSFGSWNKELQLLFLAMGVALFFMGTGRYRVYDTSSRHWLLD
jgi:putative oxidoreductase